MTNVFTLTIKDKQSQMIECSINYKEIKQSILNYLLCKYSITYVNYETEIVPCFSNRQYEKISTKTVAHYNITKKTIEKFLRDLKSFQMFLNRCTIKWNLKHNNIYNKVRIYLHKLYRLAPVFDYKRARTNLKSLHKFFKVVHFWPQISTQMALVLYITDKNDYFRQKKLMNTNIRAITNCSAYAFYRSKNILKEKGLLSRNE